MFGEPIFVAFLLTVSLAIILAIFLAWTAAKKHASDQIVSQTGPVTASADIDQELQKYFRGPAHQSHALKQKITHVIEREVEKKISVKTEEITQRYNQIIDEKNKSIDFVEKQFKNVSEQYQKLDTTFKELGEEKKQTEEVVHSMAEGVILVNKKGEVILMNPAAEKLLGVKKEEQIGKPITKDLREEHLLTMTQQIEGTKQNEIVVQSRNDQTQKILRASNAVIESEDGKTVGFVSVLSDVTKQKELDQLKTSFLANISHDLRTPLTCVQGSLQLLCDPTMSKLSPEQEKIANIALNNVRRLTRLINDLLDLSKLEAKKFTIKVAPLRLDEYIRSLSNDFLAWGKSKGITLLVEIPEALEAEADQDRIGQVITNLVGNAMKFTPQGGKVTIDGKRDPFSGKIQIGVKDTGPGISKKDCQKLFEKFVQLDTPSLQGMSGTGLGLAIVKEIVELHHGRVWVESEEGKGTRFAFELPVRQAARTANP